MNVIRTFSEALKQKTPRYYGTMRTGLCAILIGICCTLVLVSTYEALAEELKMALLLVVFVAFSAGLLCILLMIWFYITETLRNGENSIGEQSSGGREGRSD